MRHAQMVFGRARKSVSRGEEARKPQTGSSVPISRSVLGKLVWCPRQGDDAWVGAHKRRRHSEFNGGDFCRSKGAFICMDKDCRLGCRERNMSMVDDIPVSTSGKRRLETQCESSSGKKTCGRRPMEMAPSRASSSWEQGSENRAVCKRQIEQQTQHAESKKKCRRKKVPSSSSSSSSSELCNSGSSSSKSGRGSSSSSRMTDTAAMLGKAGNWGALPPGHFP